MSVQLRLAAREVNENQTARALEATNVVNQRWPYSCMGYRELKQRGTSRFPSYPAERNEKGGT